MEPSFIEWIVGQAGIGGLAALALYLLNREHQDAMRRERENAETHRADKLKLMDTLANIMAQLARLESEHDSRPSPRPRKGGDNAD